MSELNFLSEEGNSGDSTTVYSGEPSKAPTKCSPKLFKITKVSRKRKTAQHEDTYATKDFSYHLTKDLFNFNDGNR